MPYGKRLVENVELDFDLIFDQFICPGAEAAGLQVVRSDRDVASGVIMPRLFESIYSADLVIAELTYQNPNVYYELGLRHALRPRGTILIRRSGGDLGVKPLGRRRGAIAETAFDIRGITIWSYDVSHATLPSDVDSLRDRIARVASAVQVDSPAFLYLDGLKVTIGSPRAHPRDDQTYQLLNKIGKPIDRFVGYRSGDLGDLRDERRVDFWVNSENVLMQMARIYERSISSTIRYLGARQPDPTAPEFDDTIADDLRRQLGRRNSVSQGEVLVTTSGRLRDTHGVRAVLHAAVVTGAHGRGFHAIADDLLVETTRTLLRRVRELIRTGGPEMHGDSVILPLFGTGQGRMDPYKIIERLLEEAIQDLGYHATLQDPAATDLRTVLFSTFTQDHVLLLQRLMENLVERRVLTRTDGRLPARGSSE
jgi:hypothetical protein